MDIKYIPQEHANLIELAKAIASFKTKEMELVFCELVKKAINPPIMYTGAGVPSYDPVGKSIRNVDLGIVCPK